MEENKKKALKNLRIRWDFVKLYFKGDIAALMDINPRTRIKFMQNEYIRGLNQNVLAKVELGLRQLERNLFDVYSLIPEGYEKRPRLLTQKEYKALGLKDEEPEPSIYTRPKFKDPALREFFKDF